MSSVVMAGKQNSIAIIFSKLLEAAWKRAASEPLLSANLYIEALVCYGLVAPRSTSGYHENSP